MGRMRGGALALLLVAAPAFGSGERTCKPVVGRVSTAQTTVGCTSPIGICFAGTLQTNRLRGTTYFTVTSVTPIPGTTLEAFTGIYTITQRDGEVITLASSGVVDTATDVFIESFAGTTGGEQLVLTATGTTNSTLSEFSGRVTGSICEGVSG